MQRVATVVWLTGLSGAGKTTIGAALVERLGARASLLDGDELRRTVSRDLGFSPADRAENVRRAAQAALELAMTGGVAVVALISPEVEARRRARALVEAAGVRFVEVYVSTCLAECERRDPKGLYRRARAGELAMVTGIDQPYDVPAAPELVIASGEPVASAVERIVDSLRT